MQRPLAYYNNPILRKKCAPIEAITDEVRQVVEDLIDTVTAHDGAGLAAPQIHELMRIFVICIPEEEEEDQKGSYHPREFINPKLSSPSKEEWVAREGCLSIPGPVVNISRPQSITVEAINIRGETFKKTFYGWEARAIMHENDHLNGVLCIDRAQSQERQEIKEALREIKNNYPQK